MTPRPSLGPTFPWGKPIAMKGEISARAAMGVTTIVLSVETRRVTKALVAFGGATLIDGAAAAVPVLVELWRVKHGEMRAAGMTQSALYELSGATSGAWLGATTGAVAGLMKSLRAGPVAALSAVFQGATQGAVRGAETGKRSGRLASEIASQHLGRYEELLIGVPSVVVGSSGPCCAVVGMYTDSAFARVADQALGYGFHKRKATFEIPEPGTCRVTDDHGAPLLEVTFVPAGAPPRQLTDAVRDYHSQPLLGLRPGGTLVTSTFKRDVLDPPRCLSGEITVGDGLATVLEGGGHPRSLHSPTPSAAAYVLHSARVSVALGLPAPLAGGDR